MTEQLHRTGALRLKTSERDALLFATWRNAVVGGTSYFMNRQTLFAAMAKKETRYVALTHGPTGNLTTFELFVKGKGVVEIYSQPRQDMHDVCLVFWH